MPEFPSIAALPEWLDADRLRWLTLFAMGLLVVVGLGVARFVQRLVTMMLGIGLIGGLIFALWVQRDELGDCQATCSCRLFGQEVSVPHGRLCGENSLIQPES